MTRIGSTWRRPGRTRRTIALLAALAAASVIALGAPVLVWVGTAGARSHATTAVPDAPVAIVLGAGIDGNGNPSPFLAERIAVAAQLYRQGTVRALLMSGDNSRTDHDEVGVMAAQAQRLGVPATAIVQDHAGFDTYSSCYRARSVWGISRAVVVTQPFHLPRAIWLCRALGVDTVGAGTGNDDTSATLYGWVREVPAIDKSVLDVVRGRVPIFPGPRDHTLDAVTAVSS